ncbi:DNA excision repair protein ERCC-8, partial [Nowakowskiella sp. JEL0078]
MEAINTNLDNNQRILPLGLLQLLQARETGYLSHSMRRVLANSQHRTINSTLYRNPIALTSTAREAPLIYPNFPESYKFSSRALKNIFTTLRFANLDLSTKINILNHHFGPINDIQIETVDGRYLLSGGTDGEIHIYDLADPDIIKTNTASGKSNINNGNLRTKHVVKSVATVERVQRHKFSVSGINWFPSDTGLFTSSSMDMTVK